MKNGVGLQPAGSCGNGHVHADETCFVVGGCDQCGRRVPQLHVSGGRAYCGRC